MLPAAFSPSVNALVGARSLLCQNSLLLLPLSLLSHAAWGGAQTCAAWFHVTTQQSGSQEEGLNLTSSPQVCTSGLTNLESPPGCGEETRVSLASPTAWADSTFSTQNWNTASCHSSGADKGSMGPYRSAGELLDNKARCTQVTSWPGRWGHCRCPQGNLCLAHTQLPRAQTSSHWPLWGLIERSTFSQVSLTRAALMMHSDQGHRRPWSNRV